MEKRTIAVIFGGCSPEYPVSLESSHSVVVNFDREKYDLILLGITKGGEWFRYYGGPEGIENDTWREGVCVPAVISPDRETHGIIEFGPDGVKATRIDAAFPVMHGKNGEDGTIQGLCEMAGIPIIGCGALASAICMDKDRAHRLASLAGVDVPKATVFTSMPDEAELARRAGEIGFPVFVKPARGGSSIGVSRATDEAAYVEAIDAAFALDEKVAVEEAITGVEVGCAIVGDAVRGTWMGEPDEIVVSGDGFFRIHLEKDPGANTELRCPAQLPADVMERVRAAGTAVYEALGCEGLARVDLFVTPEGEVVFNEVNSMPGLTYYSRFPQMMRVAGHELGDVLASLIDDKLACC